MDTQNILNIVATVLGISGIIGGFITRQSLKLNNKIADSIKESLTPITYEIRTLNSHLDTNKEDHKEFKIQIEDHEECLHDHDKRITVLEKKF